jgi:hypothetical protein
MTASSLVTTDEGRLTIKPDVNTKSTNQSSRKKDIKTEYFYLFYFYTLVFTSILLVSLESLIKWKEVKKHVSVHGEQRQIK